MMRFLYLACTIAAFAISCTSPAPVNQPIANNNPDSSRSDSVVLVKTVSMEDTFQIVVPDTALNLIEKDTIDCEAIINTLFHRSLYKFPVENSFKEDELTAAITEAEDSLLVIKLMFVDTTGNDRITVGWLNLNCKNKRLDQVNLQDEDVPLPPVNYDVRFLDILMRKCALDY